MLKVLHECIVVHEGSIPGTAHGALSNGDLYNNDQVASAHPELGPGRLCEAHLRAKSAMTGPQTSGRSARWLSSGCTTPLTCNGVIAFQLCGLMHRCPAFLM